MSRSIDYLLNNASKVQIEDHLLHCDTNFVPPLSERVEIGDYALKIVNKATRFEAWSGDRLVALVATYCNDQEKRIAYITNVSILRDWMNNGIATRLVGKCIEHAKTKGMQQISLEVAEENYPAIRLYQKSGFVVGKANAPFVTMNLFL